MATHPHPRFAGYRYPAEIISTAVRRNSRFPLNLQMVEEMLAARGITVHAPIANLFHLRRDHRPVADYRTARFQAFETWAEVAGARLAA